MSEGALVWHDFLVQLRQVQHVLCSILVYNFDVTCIVLKRDIHHFLGYLGLELREIDIDFDFGVLVEPAVLRNLLHRGFDFGDHLSRLVPGSNQLGLAAVNESIPVELLGVRVIEILPFVIMRIVVRMLALFLDGSLQFALVFVFHLHASDLLWWQDWPDFPGAFHEMQ